MIVEPSRDPERYVMRWPLMPKGMSQGQAREYFDRYVKPRTYKVARFFYDSKSGLTETFEDR